MILEKAEGNPFFLEELLRSLIDSGLVVVRDGRAVATEGIADIRVPDTVQGVAAARIDALAPSDKDVLQSASVIGRAFQRPVLAEVQGRSSAGGAGGEDDVEIAGPPAGAGTSGLGDSLEELCRREIVRERSEADYLFKHAVTRDVAYNSLLKARRRALHEIAARVIEELYPDRREELSATLAHHWRAAGVHDRALEYLIAAAERARRTFSSAEALELYAAALQEAGDDRTKKIEIEENIGDVLVLAGRHEEARAHFSAALEEEPPGLAQARLLRKLGTTWVPGYTAEPAADAYAQAESVLGAVPAGEDPEWWREWVDIQAARMWLCYWVSDTSGMAAWLDRASGTLERPEARAARGPLLQMLPLLELRRTRFRPSERCLKWAQEFVEYTEQRGDLAGVAPAYFLLAFVHTWRGDLAEAQDWY